MPFATYQTDSSSLYLSEQVAAIDRYTINQLGIPATTLMKRAGRAAFELLLEQWPKVQALHIICGPGNNGGDGYVIATLAKQRNISATIWMLSEPQQLQGAALAAYQYALQEEVTCHPFEQTRWQKVLASNHEQAHNTLLVDALLGTGTHGELRAPYLQAVNAINQADYPVLSVDIPSGIAPNTGTTTTAVYADVTISFVGQKLGLFTHQGRTHSGQRYFSDLGIPPQAYDAHSPTAQLISHDQYVNALPKRDHDAHKGDCGHLLVIGGDCGIGYGYGGAPIMAATMALRTGAGLVSMAIRSEFVTAALCHQAEMMVAGIENGQALLPLLDRSSGVVVGPGLGQSPWSEQLFYHAISSDKPLIIDADALRLLKKEAFATIPMVPKEQRQWILTPHPGEAAHLLGTSTTEIQTDRCQAALAIHQRYGGAVVLKGAGTIVVTSAGQLWLCDAGNPGMASGGMGDVLSGLLGSLLVQGMSIDHAALAGTLIHSLAADLAAQDSGYRGLLATDLIPYARKLIEEHC